MADPVSWLSAMGAGAILLKASEAALKRWVEKPDRLSAEGEKIRAELRKEIERHQENNSKLRDENAVLQQRQLEHLAEIGALTLQIAKLEEAKMKISAEASRTAEQLTARNARILELERSLEVVTKERDRLIRNARSDGDERNVDTDERPALPRVRR